MKKQNENNKLPFNKAAVTELNLLQLVEVSGGTSTTVIGSTSTVTTTLLFLTIDELAFQVKYQITKS